MKKILIVGSGGREHALAWKISQSSNVEKVFVAPGNGGTALEDKTQNVDIAVNDNVALVKFAIDNNIDFCVIGPDDALANGLADDMAEVGIKAFGPRKNAARIESSKAFSKDMMKISNINTASYQNFKDIDSALSFLKTHSLPVVVKASGLALGKGVFICQTLEEAIDAVNQIMKENIFGDSGNEIVIEDFIVGKEISTHAICDFNTSLMFPPSQDHKQIFDGDKGPNTGGMGVVAGLGLVDKNEMSKIQENVVTPILKTLKENDSTFKGCLYPGLMFKDGIFKAENAFVIEFNSRFGDPETQSYMPLLTSDLLELLEDSANDSLNEYHLTFENMFSVCVVLASKGYPNSYEKGFEISGIEKANEIDDVKVFHAGTKFENNQILTNGGRVLNVVAKAETIAKAIEKTYLAVDLIDFEGKYYRSDIGSKWL